MRAFDSCFEPQILDMESKCETQEKENQYLKRALESVYSRFNGSQSESDGLGESSSASEEVSKLLLSTQETLRMREKRIEQLMSEVDGLKSKLHQAKSKIASASKTRILKLEGKEHRVPLTFQTAARPAPEPPSAGGPEKPETSPEQAAETPPADNTSSLTSSEKGCESTVPVAAVPAPPAPPPPASPVQRKQEDIPAAGLASDTPHPPPPPPPPPPAPSSRTASPGPPPPPLPPARNPKGGSMPHAAKLKVQYTSNRASALKLIIAIAFLLDKDFCPCRRKRLARTGWHRCRFRHGRSEIGFFSNSSSFESQDADHKEQGGQ